jgi:CheY-like chemotaxis protein
MTEPLALICYQRLLPGSQLVNRLQDLGYRVRTLGEASSLPTCAAQEKPLLVLVDLETSGACEAVGQLKRAPATGHVPVLAFADEGRSDLQTAARQAGATLVVSTAALLPQLRQLLDQALEVT